jgi:hypothetical protein
MHPLTMKFHKGLKSNRVLRHMMGSGKPLQYVLRQARAANTMREAVPRVAGIKPLKFRM